MPKLQELELEQFMPESNFSEGGILEEFRERKIKNLNQKGQKKTKKLLEEFRGQSKRIKKEIETPCPKHRRTLTFSKARP